MNDRATNPATCAEARQALNRFYRSGQDHWNLEWHLLMKVEECCEEDR